MYFEFDKFDRLEQPIIKLCELSKEPIAYLNVIDLEGNFYFNDISTISFKVKKTINGEEYIHFDDVKELRLVHLEHFGYFQIQDIRRVYGDDSSVETLECTAYSCQVMFQRRLISGIKGEYKLFDMVNPEKSVMSIILMALPIWKIGYIDGKVEGRQRTLDIKESNMYSTITNDFYESYQALFIFDYEKFEINIYDAKTEFRDTKIYLDYENVIKKAEITVQTDKIYTNVGITGGNDLSINGVTPSDMLFNVDYFKDRMSNGLVVKLNDYEIKYESLRAKYETLLLSNKTKNEELSSLKAKEPKYQINFTKNKDGTLEVTPSINSSSGLAELQTLYKSLDNVKQVRISTNNTPYSDVNNVMITLNNLINQKESKIKSLEIDIDNIQKQLLDIRTQLKLTNNMSADEWKELSNYLIDYRENDKTFLITDIMTQDEKQQIQKELYEYNLNVLNKSCYPKYQFNISAVNFLALSKFKKFHEDFNLGSTFTLNINDSFIVKPLLLGVSIRFNDLTDFSLTFGNKTNVDDGFDFSALSNSVNTGSALSFELLKIESMSQKTSEIAKLIEGGLNLINTEITSSKNKHEVLIDDLGIRTKEYDYDTKMSTGRGIWISGKYISISDNDFKSTKVAIGEIKNPSGTGGYMYGILAELIAGTLLIGNGLHITTENNSLTVDNTGTYIKNGFLDITKGATTIKLDPSDGFSISKSGVKQMYVDTSGNVVFKGSITGGEININNRFKVDANGYMSCTSAEISGRISGSDIVGGTIDINSNFKVNSVGDVTITRGSLNIGGGNATIDTSGNATFRHVTITGASSMDIGNYSGGTGVQVTSGGILRAKGAYIEGDGIFNGTIYARNIDVSKGKIKAAMIEVENIIPNRISAPSNSNVYLTLGAGDRADLSWYGTSGRVIYIMQRSARDFILSTGDNMAVLVTDSSASRVQTEANWIFSRSVSFQGSVTGLNLTAKFG